LNFVSPLVESLKHKMLPDNSFNDKFSIKRIKIEDSIKNALTNKPPVLPSFKAIKKEKNTVRSVQRISNPSLRDTSWIANQYPVWITKKFAGIINAKFDGIFLTFWFLNIKFLELKLIKDRSDEKRQLYYITGGVLVKRVDYGWLEFRSISDNKFIIVAIHEFVPKLPWIIYKYTQAIAHLYVMKSFEKYLINLKN